MASYVNLEIAGIAGTILAAAGIIVVRYFRGVISEWFVRIITKIKSPLFLSKLKIERYLHINQLLSELRLALDGSRVCLFEFQNGDHFSPMNPSWKLSNTQEVCKESIRYCGNQLQELKISLMIDVLGGMLLGDYKDSGATLIKCKKCPKNYNCDYRHVYFYDVTSANPTYFKQLCMSCGSKYILWTNLHLNGKPFGFIYVDFCNPGVSIDKLRLNVIKLCETAEKIQFMLSHKNI